MARFLLLLAGFIIAHSMSAQSTRVRSFMVGPAVGINQMSYLGSASSTTSPANFMFGFDASYQSNRLLFGVRPLYGSRTHREVVPALDPNNPSFSPGYGLRVNTDYETLTVPLSISYKLNKETQYQLYIGASVALDYLLSAGNQSILSPDGTTRLERKPALNELGKPLTVGYGLQTTLRYLLTSRLGLQLEPAVRYYPVRDFPTVVSGNIQVQGTVSLLVKL